MGYRFVRLLLIFLSVQGIGYAAGNYGAVESDTNRTDKKGRKQGLWIKKESGRSLSYVGHFKDDMPEGWFTYTREPDTLVAKAFYFRGGYASYNRFFYADGSLMAEGYYLDKRKDSVWRFYASSGRLLKEESYENGLLHGERRLYTPEGRLAERQGWFRGMRNGPWFIHDEQGYQWSTYKLNMTHGAYLVFYPDSTRFIEGAYEEGLKQGKWSFFLPGGTLYKEDTYVNNRLTDRRLYVKISGELRPVSMDTIPLVMLHPAGQRAELLGQSGRRWICDEKFETVCRIFDQDFYFFANKNTFVSFSAVDMDALADVLPQADSDEAGTYDGQLDQLQQLGRNASVTPVRLPLRIETPFPVFLDAAGMDVLRNNGKKAEVEPE